MNFDWAKTSEDRRNPCKNCSERYVGCHSKCLKYIDWKQAKDAYNTMIREDKDIKRVIKKSHPRKEKR